MTERMIENRIKKLTELEEQITKDFEKNIFIFIRDDKRGLDYGADAKRIRKHDAENI